MSKLSEFLGSVAPTVASALLGPVGGVAVAAIGKAFGVDAATTESLTKIIEGGKVTPEAMAELQKLELQFQNDEKERGFRNSELEFKDRDSARQANVTGGTQTKVFWLSVIILLLSFGSEIYVLFNGYSMAVDAVVVGRILGFLDAAALQALAYWLGSSHGSQQKTEIMAAK